MTRPRSGFPVLLAFIASATALRLDAKAPRSGQAAVSAQEVTPGDSVDRVRAALEKPPSKLALNQRTPDFIVHIEKRRPMQDIFDVPPWQLEPHGWQPPAIGFDLMSVVRYVAKSVSDAKRGHDERVAREDVQRAIEEYCAGQPDSAAGVQMCSTLPAIR